MCKREYRLLRSDEVTQLEDQGCTAGDWGRVMVGEGFSPDYVRNTEFSGEVRLGANGSVWKCDDGTTFTSGIYNARLAGCSVGNNVCIRNIGGVISRYDIADDAVVENAASLVCTGGRRFGNGTRVAAVNENGGRAVTIYSELSAQAAYLMAMYRHRQDAVAALERITEEYCKPGNTIRGSVGKGAVIRDCGRIEDVCVGAGAKIAGALSLTNGTLVSTAESPVHIGPGVVMEDFICRPGAHVTNNAVVKRSFIGEACHIEDGFTSVDSLFFANSHMGGGEACSVFAGPYCVSHHKSSLLIAGYFLFFNAGSGANQSNHLFKTGAVHQGVHERGCKFGSNAYVMLPAREGAFTVVTGRHTSHHDTADLPYSYLIENEGRSYLLPGMNLRSYGTLRDLQKWPQRDVRKGVVADRVNFDEFNPYIGMKLKKGLDICRGMNDPQKDVYTHGRARISSVMAARGAQLYDAALKATIGGILSGGAGEGVADGHWVDMAGMYAPKSRVDELLDALSDGTIADVAGLEEALDAIASSYRADAYSWALSMLDGGDIAGAIEDGKQAAAELEKMRQADARKDAGDEMMTSYGIDSDDTLETAADFGSVRGL